MRSSAVRRVFGGPGPVVAPGVLLGEQVLVDDHHVRRETVFPLPAQWARVGGVVQAELAENARLAVLPRSVCRIMGDGDDAC